MENLTVLSFRKFEDIKRLARHFQNVVNHPTTQQNKVLHSYLRTLDQTHKNIYLQKRDYVEVEYIFTTEKKSSLQRQRFNSLPVSEVPELLKAELLTSDDAKQVHICTDCNIEIELSDEEPLMESLQRHFNSDAHLPKLRRESMDVAEPIILPNMSRRLSAMAELPLPKIKELTITKPVEKLEKNFSSKLSTSLMKILPDASEASVDAALKFYQEIYDKLCSDVSNIDFSTQTSSVAPIIMSIKDNVYQNFAGDANKNIDNDENDQAAEKSKNQVKKYRYYGPIAASIIKLLVNHKLLSLIDDRTGKLAFFCIACEYYTLRFHYDSVLNHVFSPTHVHNLSCILQSDKSISFSMTEPTVEKIKEINDKFLLSHDIVYTPIGLNCRLCATPIESVEASILHILDEKHLAKLSDELYLRMKDADPDGAIPEEWGPKDLNWIKYLASVGKPHNNRDHVVIENFIKPSGKIGNYCTCCDMTLKGPRQVLFNHIRQKKHLRNAAPRKLSMLYKNHCRPSEYYASFGNFYICTICPDFVAAPSISAMVEHFESASHFDTIAKLIRSALYNQADLHMFAANKITADLKCEVCKTSFHDKSEAVKHILSSVDHETAVAEAKINSNKGDIISVYMKGNHVLHSEGATFTCVDCKGVFNSIRSLLTHLVYASHFKEKPAVEAVFRFYLELKHNINMLARNKYVYYQFGKLKCGVCDADLEEGETAKKHVVSTRHRENMGASYVSIDTSAVE
ncbi:unnamed protein product [Spodoptera littoralis]|uniref:C2H2-type domain-containing protein n=1 Tax=Spodoptera littoralis TaxID=7109 RepID=A0A9P0IBA4_SPOLI|nr:unnamed protein product [Spodoptera littoralis]CAH1642706.1 unnamed protein product [Spodoptera littoralis]